MTSFDAPGHRQHGGILKRSFDVAAASVVLVLTLPIAVVAGLAIKLSSPRRPVLVRQIRVGKDGERFEMLRFRTAVEPTPVRSAAAVPGPDPTREAVSGSATDQQVTAVGRVLRWWSIDALPQWWNVLRGDMSVVGPPPSVPTDREERSDQDRAGHSPPGLTGLWRSSAR